jgi:hypothetical protein
MTPKRRRKAVDIELSDARAAFALLPPYTGHQYVSYSSTNMKHAPKWAEVVQFRQTIFKLLQASDGQSINQVSLLAHFQAFLSPDPVDLASAEQSVYLLRCMMNQLINHKQRQRTPPREMQRPFGSIWEIIEYDADDVGESDEEVAEIISVSPAPPQPELIDLETSVLEDADPELQAILNQDLQSAGREALELPGVLQDEDPELHRLLNMGEDCSAPELLIRGMGGLKMPYQAPQGFIRTYRAL